MRTLQHASPLSLLQAIAENSDDATFFKNLSGNYVYCNPASFHFFGRDAAEVCSLHDEDIFPADDAQRFSEHDRRVLQTGLSDTAEYTITGRSGVRRYRITKSLVVDQSGVPCGISGNVREVATSLQARETLRRIASFNMETGADYFRSLVRYLCEICNVRIALIGELDPEDCCQINGLSIFVDGQIRDKFSYDLRNTPSEHLLNSSLCYYTTEVKGTFLQDVLLSEMAVDSYMGIPLFGSSGKPLGIIAMLHDKPFAIPEEAQAILQIVAGRAGSEMERVQTEDRLRLSEERHRNMLERLPLGVVLHCGNQFLYANPMARTIMGIEHVEDLQTSSPFELVVEEDRERVRSLFRGSGETSVPLPMYRTQIRRSDEAVLDIDFTLLRTSYGKHRCHQVHFSDVTARRHTEEALRESQDQFLLFMQHLSGLAWIKNLRGEYLYANPAALSTFQRSPEDLYGKTDSQVFPRETAEQFVENDRRVLSAGHFLLSTETYQHRDGILHYSLVNKFPIRGPEGDIKFIGGIATDITELVQAEKTIRELNDFHEAIIRTAAEGICVCYEIPDFPYVRFTVWNHQMTELTGYMVTEINEGGWYQLLYPDPEQQARAIRRMQEMRSQIDLQAEEWEITRKDGQRRILSISTSTVQIEDGVLGTVGMMHDVTERLTAAVELHRTTNLLCAVMKGVTDSVFVKDLSGRYLLLNDSAAANFGKSPEELIGTDDSYLLDAESAVGLMQKDHEIMRNGRIETFEESVSIKGVPLRFHSTKGPYRNAAGEVIGLIGISRDITRQKLLEDQLHQAQKMEAIGQLAGGIAHDFNNLLTVINGYTEMILSDLSKDDQLNEPLTLVSEAGQRAAGLTAQLLAFSRKTIIEPKRLNLRKVIEHLGRMLRRLIGEDIVLNLDLGGDQTCIFADLGQTEQMLLNLALNARDAMPRGGSLTMRVQDIELFADDSRLQDLTAGKYIQIEVTDTGTGIPPELRERVFEPFFTTKDAGTGTGLGLATVYGIVKQAGGNIRFESAIGEGTTFVVLLPAILSVEASAEISSGDLAPVGSETICFVEDEESVRGLVRHVLETQGYTVIAAGSGAEALALAASYKGKINLLLTDVVMPGMNGRQLAERFRQQWPWVQVLYMSGYTGDAIVRYGVETAADAFLQKPFTPLGLARKVRQTLDRR